jgi:hypothetical protein
VLGSGSIDDDDDGVVQAYWIAEPIDTMVLWRGEGVWSAYRCGLVL